MNENLRVQVFCNEQAGYHAEWEQIAKAYDQILLQEAPLFVFGAFERIVDLVSRLVVDEYGLGPTMMVAIQDWSNKFRGFARSADELPMPSDSFSPVDDLGSTRRWLETTHRDGTDEWPYMEKSFPDFRHFKLQAKPGDNVEGAAAALENFDYYLRWSRSPQSWNYTFIESLNGRGESERNYFSSIAALLCACSIEPSVLRSRAFADLPAEREFPGFLLAGAHYFLIPIDMLLALSIVPAEQLGLNPPSNITPILYRLRRSVNGSDDLARAHRFFKAMSDGLAERQSAVALLLDACLNVHGRDGTRSIFVRHWDTGHQTPAELGLKDAIGALLEDLHSKPAGNRDDGLRQLIRFISGGDVPLQTRGVYRFFGNLIKHAVTNPGIHTASKTVVLRHVAAVTQMFWDFAIAPNLSSELSRAAQAGGHTDSNRRPVTFANDFVCSSMIEGRCLYFSNFIPENEDLFTRTLFIDLGMEGLQSARVLQRLSDILTYRSMPIRQLERVNAAIEALLELNMMLNRFQGGEASHELPKLRLQLEEALGVSRAVGRLNGFITYGVAGQWHSAEAYLKQILERCEDLREERIEGYAKLTDFVKRRLTHSVRFVERMYGHQSTVARRVTEILDRIRTELDAVQTEQISSALVLQNRTMTDMAVTSRQLVKAVEGLRDVSNEMQNNLALQTRQLNELEKISRVTKGLLTRHTDILWSQAGMLKAAEALILVGSSYYLFSFWGYLGHPWIISSALSGTPWNAALNILIMILIFLATFGLAVVFTKFWPKLDAVIGRWFNRGTAKLQEPPGEADTVQETGHNQPVSAGGNHPQPDGGLSPDTRLRE